MSVCRIIKTQNWYLKDYNLKQMLTCLLLAQRVTHLNSNFSFKPLV